LIDQKIHVEIEALKLDARIHGGHNRCEVVAMEVSLFGDLSDETKRYALCREDMLCGHPSFFGCKIHAALRYQVVDVKKVSGTRSP